MTWEALNNISDDNERNLVIVVNDNGRSYAPTIGGMARYMNRVRTAGVYRDLHRKSDRFFRAFGPVGRAFYRGVRGGTHGFLSRFSNNEELYSNLDIKYLGPIDGHIPSLLETLQLAKDYGAPVIVHVITEKGRGYSPRSTTRRISSTRSARSTRRPASPSRRAASDGPTCSPTHWSTSVRAPRSHRDDGGDAAAHRARPVRRAVPRPRLRRRHRRAARRDVRGGARPAVCTRWSRSTPRSWAARSTRC
jgi:hypothetical protein